MNIKELSNLTGMSSSSIRFYEEQGLLPNPVRTSNGYRSYPPDMVAQVQMIMRAKELGFTLKEIRELATLLFSQKLNRSEMKNRLKNKNLEIDDKIKNLKIIQNEINRALSGMCNFQDNLSP